MAKVLIIDDENSIRRTLREILMHEKYEVSEAVDAIEGLSLLKTKSFDVILLDIKMPKMDGMEAFERIKEICPEKFRI